MTRSQRSKLRFPMFLKFLIGCLVLAGLLIVGGTIVVQNETQLKSRGNYLERQVRLYHGYEQRAGAEMTNILEVMALQVDLVARVEYEADVEAGVTPLPQLDDDVLPADKMSEELAKQLACKDCIAPELFAVFTARNKLLWTEPGSDLTPEAMPQLAAVAAARSGSVFANQTCLINNVPYQISAIPIREPKSNAVVGGILAGVKLERYYQEFAAQSDDDPQFQLRLTLLDGPNILATAWPPDHQNGLGKAMQPENLVRVTVGQDTRNVVRLPDGDHDIYSEELEGYKGLGITGIGTLTMTHSRANIVDPASHIPWLEIAIGVGLSVLIALLMAFWITRPIKQFVRQSRDLLEGDTDLTQRIVVDSRDETADLAENINQVFARLEHLATDVQSAAFQVGASSAEISAASKQTLAGLKDQTLKIEGSTAAITELSASIQQVAGNSAQANQVAEESNQAVTSAVKGMEQIRTSVEEAAEKMRELGESSKRIGNIVEVIRQISEQTSMLALNASIEAAHAGEQGRGFAVVADEVSSLARRVGQSAKDIEVLIQTIKEQTQAATASMDVGTREVENGSMLVTSTLTGLGQLITVVKDTSQAVQEQAVVSDEIARNMDAVQHIANEVLSGSEESVVQSERLHELAFQLEESIGGFNLEASGKGATAREGKRLAEAAAPRALPASGTGKQAAKRT